MSESSPFNVDLESSKPRHYPNKPHYHLSKNQKKKIVLFSFLSFIIISLFFLNHYKSSDKLSLFSLNIGINTETLSMNKNNNNNNDVINNEKDGTIEKNMKNPEIIEEEDDEVANKNKKVAEKAAARMKYTTDEKGNGKTVDNLLPEDLKVKPNKGFRSKPIANKQHADNFNSNNNNNNKNFENNEVKTTLENPQKKQFNPSNEFKAIVALSPVIIFTWETNTAIPLTNTETTTNDELVSSKLLSKNLLKTLGEHYQITPVPTYVSLDKHPHYKELAIYINDLYRKLNPKLKSLSSTNDEETLEKRFLSNSIISRKYKFDELEEDENILPGIIIAGKPIANSRQLQKAHEDGMLLDLLKSLGDGIVNIERVG